MNKTISGILIAGALLAVVPWLGLPAFYESFLYLICHWMILALSWNILSGYSGYFSFGHGVFFGVGMYTTAGLAGKLDWPFFVHAAPGHFDSGHLGRSARCGGVSGQGGAW